MKLSITTLVATLALSGSFANAGNSTIWYDEEGQMHRSYKLMPTSKTITDDNGIELTQYRLWPTTETLVNDDGLVMRLHSTAPSDQNLAEMQAAEFDQINLPAFDETPAGLPAAAAPKSVYPDFVGP